MVGKRRFYGNTENARFGRAPIQSYSIFDDLTAFAD